VSAARGGVNVSRKRRRDMSQRRYHVYLSVDDLNVDGAVAEIEVVIKEPSDIVEIEPDEAIAEAMDVVKSKYKNCVVELARIEEYLDCWEYDTEADWPNHYD